VEATFTSKANGQCLGTQKRKFLITLCHLLCPFLFLLALSLSRLRGLKTGKVPVKTRRLPYVTLHTIVNHPEEVCQLTKKQAFAKNAKPVALIRKQLVVRLSQ
jgi:hypothetical protein